MLHMNDFTSIYRFGKARPIWRDSLWCIINDFVSNNSKYGSIFCEGGDKE